MLVVTCFNALEGYSKVDEVRYFQLKQKPFWRRWNNNNNEKLIIRSLHNKTRKFEQVSPYKLYGTKYASQRHSSRQASVLTELLYVIPAKLMKKGQKIE